MFNAGSLFLVMDAKLPVALILCPGNLEVSSVAGGNSHDSQNCVSAEL